jgi:putative ABC transport system permease protein
MRALDRKLLRDLGYLRGQVITIAAVVACGIASFVALRGTLDSLRRAQDAYYAEQRFGDVFVSVRRAPESLRARLEALPGVAVAYTRLSELVMLPLADMAEPAVGRVVSLPADGRAPLGGVLLVAGRLPRTGDAGEAVVLEAFARVHGLVPGSRIPAILNGTRREVRVVGLGMSPEFVFASAGPFDFSGDPRRFAVLWMDRPAIAPFFQLEGAFDDVVVKLQPGASEPAVVAALDRLLAPWGSYGAVGRSKQMSHAMLEGELAQLEGLALWVPALFLFVAAFLLHVVLTRLVSLQRPQIATLQALGYPAWRIGAHYVELVSVVVVAGAILGVGLGAWFGGMMSALYAKYFHFPGAIFHLEPRLAFVGIAVSVASALAGALGAVRAILRLAPAEAMRPPAPALYRVGLIERFRLDRPLGGAGRMVLRELRRRPLRALFSSVGLALGTGIVVLGSFQQDAMDAMVDAQFFRAWQEDLSVVFVRSVPERVLRELSRLPGVTRAEGQRYLPVRFRAGPRQRDGVIVAHERTAALRRILDRDGRVATLPEDGLLLSAKLAELLDVRAGETVRVEVKEGARRERDVPVVALIDDAFGLMGHMDARALHRLVGEEPRVSLAALRVDPRALVDVEARLIDRPGVLGVTRRLAIVERFRAQSGETMRFFTLTLTAFAVIITVGVVYNNARVALSLRGRDLASLRVLGFTRREISAVLLGELAVHVLVALPLGLLAGNGMARLIASTIDPEQYRMPLLVSTRTHAFAASVALGAALLSAMLVRRRLDRLDLVEVLKEHE